MDGWMAADWGADPLHFPSGEGGEEEVLGKEVGVLTLQLQSISLTCQQFWRTGSGDFRQHPDPDSRQDRNPGASIAAPTWLPHPRLWGWDSYCPLSLQHLIHTQVSLSSCTPLGANCNSSLGFPTTTAVYTGI